MIINIEATEKPPVALYLAQLANDFDNASRFGSEEDVPEGERYIVMSDTLARQIATELREYTNALTENTGR